MAGNRPDDALPHHIFYVLKLSSIGPRGRSKVIPLSRYRRMAVKKKTGATQDAPAKPAQAAATEGARKSTKKAATKASAAAKKAAPKAAAAKAAAPKAAAPKKAA